MAEETISIAALSEERMRLEREAFEIERQRLEAARARAEAELKIARSGHPFLIFASVSLLALVAFAGGMLLGIYVNESRHQSQRDARLREALAQISGLTDVTVTNAVPAASAVRVTGGGGNGASPSRAVSVVVIQ